MRIAVFHNFMDNIGGAEVVSLMLARYLGADIYTTNVSAENITRMGFADVLPRIHSIGKVPIKAPWRHQTAFLKFRRLNLGQKYDFYIISGDWAMSAAVNHHPNLWYVHSPLNELWEFKDYIRKNILGWWQRPIFDMWVAFNRTLTLRWAKRVDGWVCNSINTQKRIRKFYGVEAAVIYPPIETKKYVGRLGGKYWLSVNRLLFQKRVDMQVKAFARLPEERLVVVGSYERGAGQFEGYKQYIENSKPKNVEIRHWVSDDELKKLYEEAKGFIITAFNEDFGMVPVEAMAAGKPVIAPNEGGFSESVVNGVTGVLVDNINDEKLTEAVRQLSRQLRDPAIVAKYARDCKARAELFSAERFIGAIKIKIESILKKG